MARVTLNPAFAGLSGRSGGLVYRQVNDVTVVARRPKAPAGKATPRQAAQRLRFRRAGEYAAQVLADPCQRRVYESMALAQKRRPDRLVVSDFLTPPVVDAIELSGYRGRVGDVIRVIATDDVEVVAVMVKIQRTSGATLEEGAAAKVHGVWVYEAKSAAPAAGVSITATAVDRPGNEGTKSVSYP